MFFTRRSGVPHTYDYLLHSFGRPNPVSPKFFSETGGLGDRYFVVRDQKTATTDDAWAFDFVVDEETTREREKSRSQQKTSSANRASKKLTLATNGTDIQQQSESPWPERQERM